MTGKYILIGLGISLLVAWFFGESTHRMQQNQSKPLTPIKHQTRLGKWWKKTRLGKWWSNKRALKNVGKRRKQRKLS